MSRYYLGRTREEVPSVFSSGKVYKGETYKQIALNFWGNEFIEKYIALSKWEEVYKKNIGYFIVDSHKTMEYKLPLGISSEFKQIKTVNHVKKFTAKYGLLGINKLKDFEIMDVTNSKTPINLGISTIEPIECWYDCARKVRCIIALYESLQNAFNKNSELDLEFEEIKGNNDVINGYICKWVYIEDGEINTLSVFCSPDEIEDCAIEDIAPQNLKIGHKILVKSIKHFIDGYIYIDEEIIPNNFSSIGIEITERKYTETLITAIFYDLWLLLVANVPTGRCKRCNKPFLQTEKGRKRQFCSESCRVIWNRKNKQ